MINPAHSMKITALLSAGFLFLCLGGCLNRFISNRVLVSHDVIYCTPKSCDLNYENLTLKKKNGETLNAWFFPHPNPKGTVLMFHGTLVNMSFLIKYNRLFYENGYQSMIFDYQGFARSSGRHSVANLVDDGETALIHLQNRPDVDPDKIVFHGYSLGTAVSLALAVKHPEIRGLLLEGIFAPDVQLREMFGVFAPIARGLANFFVLPKGWNPVENAALLGKRPVLFIERGDDSISSTPIFLRQAGSNARYLHIDGASHVSFLIDHPEYRSQMLAFFDAALHDKAALPLQYTWKTNSLNDREYELRIEYELSTEATVPLACEINLFHDDVLRGRIRDYFSEARGSKSYVLPKRVCGQSTDAPDGRFDLSGEFPGWRLKARAIELENPKSLSSGSACQIAWRYETRPVNEKRLRQEFDLTPNMLTINSWEYAQPREECRYAVKGTLLVGNTDVKTKAQPFIGTYYSRELWQAPATTCIREEDVLDVLDFDPLDRVEDIIGEIRKAEPESHKVYAYHKFVNRVLESPESRELKLLTVGGENLHVDTLGQEEFIARVFQMASEEIPELEEEGQRILRRLFPDCPKALRQSPKMDRLGKLLDWRKENAERLRPDWKNRCYRLAKPDHAKDGEDLAKLRAYEIRFDLKPNQKYWVGFGRQSFRILAERRETLSISLDDPVKAFYALLTDDLIALIFQQNIHRNKDAFIAEAFRLAGLEADANKSFVENLAALRVWFESNHANLKWNAKAKKFEMK